MRWAQPKILNLDQGVIVATDSRFTIGAGYDDAGQKLYPLARNAIAIFAGDVLAAQRALNDAKTYLLRRGESLKDPTEPVADILRRAYAKHQRVRPVNPLFVLVGVCNEAGESWVVKYSSESNFQPLYLLGVEAVGWPKDVKNFRNRLLELEAERWQKNELDVDPRRWRFDVAASMREALESSDRTTAIGGGIQIRIVTKEGVQPIEHMSYVKQGQDPMDELAWTQVTVAPGEDVRPFRRVGHSASPNPEPGLQYEHVLDGPAASPH